LKYGILAQYLSQLKKNVKKLEFKKIEDILGFPLPKSARLYRSWWANDKTHVQANDGWLCVDWKVESIDLKGETVTFRKLTKDEREKPETTLKKNLPRTFEDFARAKMSKVFGKELMPRMKKRWAKLFDMVSKDYKIVGEAKYLGTVQGKRIPPAKFSVIAEHVWMLEKTNAPIKFLVFGNNRRIPEEWLKRYGKLAKSVKFYFLTDDDKLIPLNESGGSQEVEDA